MAKWLLLACTALLVLHGALAQGADPCVMDGFDLTDLHNARYWNVTLAKDKCIVPKNYTRRDIANCTIHFSICQPLPQEICVSQTNSSTCEVVITSDRKMHYFNIGNYQGNNEFEPTGGTDVGFATIRQGNANDSALCNSTFATILSFRCEPTTRWDHTKNNVTLFAESNINFEACLLDLSFNYSGACYEPPTLAPNRCQLDRYDLTGLTSLDYWFATLSNNQTCLIPNASSCVVYFSFCQGLPLSTGDGCYEAAVCQAGKTSGGSVSYSMGQLNEHSHFLDAQTDFTLGSFYILVEGGDTICTSANKRASTRIVLTCDPAELWNDRNLSGRASVTQLDCVYTITIPFAGACLLPASSTAHAPTPTPKPSPSTTEHPTSTKSGSSTSATKSHSANSTASHTKVSPSPTSMHHATKTTSGHGTHTSTQRPAHSPTTGPPSHHTTPEEHHTTQKKPPTTQPTAKPNSHKIAGLTAGLVIFVLISVALLVMFIIAVFYIYKRRKAGGYEVLQDSGNM